MMEEFDRTNHRGILILVGWLTGANCAHQTKQPPTNNSIVVGVRITRKSFVLYVLTLNSYRKIGSKVSFRWCSFQSFIFQVKAYLKLQQRNNSLVHACDCPPKETNTDERFHRYRGADNTDGSLPSYRF